MEMVFSNDEELWREENILGSNRVVLVDGRNNIKTAVACKGKKARVGKHLGISSLKTLEKSG